MFQIQVVRVDAVVLANSKKSKNETDDNSKGFFAMGSLVGYGLGLMGSSNQTWVEGSYLPKVVQKKLEESMGEVLSEKLEKKKMSAETLVLGEERQARFFFAKLSEIQSLKPSFPKGRIRNSNKRSSHEKVQQAQIAVADVIDEVHEKETIDHHHAR